MIHWDQIIIALLTGGALSALINAGASIIKKKMEMRRPFEKAIKNINLIYHELSDLKNKIGCDRVIIYTTKNGGGIPRPGAHLYISILFETYNKPLYSIEEFWQDRIVDKGHINILSDLDEKQIITIKAKDMEEGILKNSFIAQNVKYSCKAKIKSTSENYFYLSCHFTTPMNEIQTKAYVLDTVSKIKHIL